MKSDKLHIGLSAYNNSYWNGIFYPDGMPASKRFAYYCEHFNTYEINATFYRFPTLKSLQSWYAKSPDGFLFSVKAHKGITHFKRFKDCEEEITQLYATLREGLQDKLACVLFQLPPSFSYSEERLELIIASLDYSFRNVVEFRNESWWRQEVYDALAAKGITFCSVSYPTLPNEVMATTKTGYVRLHGVPKLFYSEYSNAELEKMHEEITEKDFDEAFVYFNNTAGPAGIVNALNFKKTALTS